MEREDTTQAEGEDTQENSAESTVQANHDIEFLKSQNAELNNKLNSLIEASKRPVETVKPLTPVEFDALMKQDPQAAMNYAIDRQLSQKTAQLENSFNTKQSQIQYDAKAEADFPLIKTDKHFQRLVKEEIQSLQEGGMSKDSPRLVYKAAEYAALKYEKTKGTKTAGGGATEISGEAPSNVTRGKSDNKNIPKNFDKMASMFGLSDKAKARAKENFDFRAKQEDARKNRG